MQLTPTQLTHNYTLTTKELLTLSVIFTKRLKPSADLRSSLLEMFWQNSLALVLESTSNACRFQTKLLASDLVHKPWWFRVIYLVRIIRKIHFMEDLGGFVLDGLYLHQVRRVLARSIAVTNSTTMWILRHGQNVQ